MPECSHYLRNEQDYRDRHDSDEGPAPCEFCWSADATGTVETSRNGWCESKGICGECAAKQEAECES